MITNNPSGPEGNNSPKNGEPLDATKKLEALGISSEDAKKLVQNASNAKLRSLKDDISEITVKESLQAEISHTLGKNPGLENNHEKIQAAENILTEVREIAERSKGQREALLAEKIGSNIPSNEIPKDSTKNIATETTDGLKAFISNSLPEAGKLVGRFFTDIPKVFSDIGASTEYLLTRADGIIPDTETKIG